jgi:hypothetical protein
VTLVGYGLYSELLLSLAEHFLKKAANIPEGIIGHNLMRDTSTLELLKKTTPRPNLLLVVPIVSTFSTSIKMEASLREKFPDHHIIDPHFNLLHVSENDGEAKPSPLEKEFGWISKDPLAREIKVKAFFQEGNNSRRQRYFLALKTGWKRTESCDSCFNMDKDENWREKPLMETDRTLVTPTMIFDYPRCNNLTPDQLSNKFELTPAMVGYGKDGLLKSHFMYQVDSEKFLIHNRQHIINWLNKLKKDKDFRKEFSNGKNILIISSCHYANAEFLRLVNEVLFLSAANIIHYDPTDGYIQNFDMIYGQEIYMADKILYVDDIIRTGNKFFKIEAFVRHTIRLRNEKEGRSRSNRLDACIFMINKSQPYTYETIRSLINKPDAIYALANLNLFTSLSSDEHSPLEVEKLKYEQLFDASVLDRLRRHFMEHAKKLVQEDRKDKNSLSAERHLLMLEATHRIYSYFSETGKPYTMDSFDDFSRSVLEETKFDTGYTLAYAKKTRFTPLQAAMLKVLTQSPFNQYQPIRIAVFDWLLDLLSDQVKNVKTGIEQDKLTYEQFLDLKFLFRRSVLLNSNLILEKKTFSMLELLFGPNGIEKLKRTIRIEEDRLRRLPHERKKDFTEQEKVQNEIDIGLSIDKKNELTTFKRIFLYAQVKELLLRNEARTSRLETLLNEGSPSGNQDFTNLLNVLKIENAFAIQKFYSYLQILPEWKELFKASKEKQYEILNRQDIIDLLSQPRIANHQQYKILATYFEKSGQRSPAENDQFISYLWLRLFIEDEALLTSGISLKQRTEFLFKELLSICLIKESPLEYRGAFLIIKDNFGQTYSVYDCNKEGHQELQWHNIDLKKEPSLKGMLKNDGDKVNERHTILEMTRETGSNKWIDLHPDEDEETVEMTENLLHPDSNRLILLRLNRRTKGGNVSLGLSGFYFNDTSSKPASILLSQYLLLLQQGLNLL